MPTNDSPFQIIINPEPLPTVIPDAGCEAAPSCPACPLPECRYDNPYGWRQYRRDQQVVAAIREHNLTDTQAAQRFGLHKRTIGRILSPNRAA